MKQALLRTFPFLLLTPYIVGWAPGDSSYSEYAIGVGGGQYATYDCNGNAHSNSFLDGGFKATHKFEAPFRVGLSASVTHAEDRMIITPYPDLALDFKYVSLGTTGLRLGMEDGTYGELGFLDQVPASSGKGFLRIGLGCKLSESTRLWLGANTLPYNATGIAGQIDFPYDPNRFVYINVRNGNSGGVPEYGFSIGLRQRLYLSSN